jgi:hypothetical protein
MTENTSGGRLKSASQANCPCHQWPVQSPARLAGSQSLSLIAFDRCLSQRQGVVVPQH